VLDRALASRGHFPAIDALASLSRLFPKLTASEHQAAASRLRALLAALVEKLDLHAMGAYEPGRDPLFDRALERRERIDSFLTQGPLEHTRLEDTVRRLVEVTS
jgi:ATP synthase in type III secretion protein N